MHVDVPQSKFGAIVGFALGAVSLFVASTLFADSIPDEVQKILKSKGRGSVVGVYVLDLDNKRPLVSINGESSLKPASVQKIATSFTALRDLGPDYRFKTKLYSTPIEKGVVDTLVVRGEGAPDFTTESMWLLARQVKKLGIKGAKKVIFDATSFENESERQGQRAYESMASALSFNFNSIAIEACPGQIGDNATVTADPWDLPIKIVSSLKTVGGDSQSIGVDEISSSPGSSSIAASYRVSGKIGELSPCRPIYRSVESPPRYFATSFLAFARLVGIDLPTTYQMGPTPSGTTERFALPSRALSSIVQDLNHFSTNFIGEQILFALGPNQDGDSFNRIKGLNHVEGVLKALEIPEAQYSVYDGSGLSHDNRLSPYAIVRILETALLTPSIRPEFEASLSVLGRSGTLKKRTPDLKGGVLRGKTGSLNGVSSLAGYLTTTKNRHLAFAILQNEVTSKESAEQVEDAIVEELAEL